ACRRWMASPGPSPVRSCTCSAARPTFGRQRQDGCGGRRQAAALVAPGSQTPTNGSELRNQSLKAGARTGGSRLFRVGALLFRWPGRAVTCGDRYADAAGTGIALGRWPILARAPVRTTPRNLVRVAGGRTPLSRPVGPPGVISAPRNSHGLPESRSRESRPTTRRPLEPHCRTAGALTHRPAVRRPDPSVLLAGTPTRISRSNRVGPSGQLLTVGLHGVAVKAAFPLARRVCPVHDGWNYLHGISGDEPRLGPSAPGC